MKFKINLFVNIYIIIAFIGFFSDTIFISFERQIKILIFILELAIIILSLTNLKILENTFYRNIFMIFLLISTITYFLSDGDILIHLNGLRYPLVFLSSLIFFNVIFNSPNSSYLQQKFTNVLVVLAILQIPASFYQMIIYGSGDKVGGTFGISGGSGIITQILFLISFYWLSIYGYDENKNSYKGIKIFIALLFLLPTLINETKITFFLLLIYILLVVKTHKQNFISFSRLLLFIPIFIISISIYDSVQNDFKISDYSEIDNIKNYFYDSDLKYSSKFNKDKLDDNVDISRISKLVLLFEIGLRNYQEMIFGLGYGIMQGQNFLGGSSVGESLMFLWYGSQGLLFSTFIQGGFVFTIIIVIALFSFYKKSNNNSQALNNFIIMQSAVFISMLFYNVAIFSSFFAIPASYLIIWCRFNTVLVSE